MLHGVPEPTLTLDGEGWLGRRPAWQENIIMETVAPQPLLFWWKWEHAAVEWTWLWNMWMKAQAQQTDICLTSMSQAHTVLGRAARDLGLICSSSWCLVWLPFVLRHALSALVSLGTSLACGFTFPLVSHLAPRSLISSLLKAKIALLDFYLLLGSWSERQKGKFRNPLAVLCILGSPHS